MPTISDRLRGHDNNFNLLRLVAASGVLVAHAWPLSLGGGVAEPLEELTGLSLGTICVIVFFVVSGFFITRSMETSLAAGGGGWPRFLRARVLRLVPGLAVMLALTGLVMGPLVTLSSPAIYWPEVPDYLVQNLLLYSPRYTLPGVFVDLPYGGINGSIWTLFYEVFCYGVVMLAGLAGLLRQRRVALAFLGLVALAFLASWMIEMPVRLRHVVQLGLPFALGGCAWLWRERLLLHPALVAALVALAFAAGGVLGAEHPLVALLRVLALSYASLWFGFADTPRLRAYNRLGDYSYGIYIYAFPVQQLVALQGVRDPWHNIAFALPVTIVLGVLSWTLIEKPAQRLGRSPQSSRIGPRLGSEPASRQS